MIRRGGEHQPPEFIVRRVCGECGLIPPFCDHGWEKQIVERYVPESTLQAAERLVALYREHGSPDLTRLVDQEAKRAE